MESPPPQTRRRRYGRWMALGLAALVAVGVVGLFYFLNALPEITRDMIQRELATRGLPPARFEIEDVGWTGMTLVDFELGDPATLRFPRLHVGFSPISLALGRAQSLEIDGLELEGHLGPEGLSLGVLDALRTQSEPAPEDGAPYAISLPRLPVEEIEINAAHLRLSTPDGPIEGELWLRLDDGKHLAFRFQSGEKSGLEKRLGISLEPFSVDAEVSVDTDQRSLQVEPIAIAFQRQQAGKEQRVEMTFPAVEILQDGGPMDPIAIKANGGRVATNSPRALIEGLNLDVVFDPEEETSSGKLALKSIRQEGAEALTAPLTLAATLVPTPKKIVADFDLSGADRQLRFRGQVEQDLGTTKGKARFEMKSLEFEPESPLLGKLFPVLGQNHVVATEGRAGLRGRVNWTEKGFRTALDLKLDDVSIANDTAGAACLSGTIRLKGPPFGTAEVEELSMSVLNIGLRLGSGEARYRLQRQQMLTIERGEWSFLGGRIITAGRFDVDANEHPFLLAAESISLAELFEMLDLEGLSGQGVLGGHLPIVIRGEEIEIRDGVLASKRDGGWIRYRPPEGEPGKLSNLGISELIDFEAALRNFRFERLVLQVNGDVRGSLTVKISLDGANPDYRDGQPYQLNLNVEGPLYRMYQAEETAFSTPARRIEERVLENVGNREVEAVSLPPCNPPPEQTPIDTALPSR